ncbi:MAG: hypothetical protein LC687_03350 [Actinobacteria bacterium]|nr:hypothetical protein [Actinomycetota bacterium]
MNYVLAVDPGGTVGYAIYAMGHDGLFSPERVQAGQAGVDDFLDWARIAITEDWLVVMERFTITTNTAKLSAGGAHDALDVIGVVKHLCRWASAQYEVQTPAQAKKFVSDRQLKNLGLWIKSQDHARDAIRHLVFGLVYHTNGETRRDLTDRLAG